MTRSLPLPLFLDVLYFHYGTVSITVCNTQPCPLHDFDRDRDSNLCNVVKYIYKKAKNRVTAAEKGKEKRKFQKKIIAILIFFPSSSMPNYHVPVSPSYQLEC